MKQALWKAYNSFSRKERHGILFLLVLTGICVAMPSFWERYVSHSAEVYTTDSILLAEVAAFHDALLNGAKVSPGNTDSGVQLRRFTFDPNTIDAAEWEALGLEKGVISTIQRYLAKGGRFWRKEDLKKIYGLAPGLCNELMPYVRIVARPYKADTSRHYAAYPSYRQDTQHAGYGRNTMHMPGVQREGVRRKEYRSSLPVLDINTADSALWESLPGIGPVLAARIVKFREKLGGFYSISQVGETYGLADTTFNKIQASLRLHKVSLKKLDLNHMDEKSLAQHPYIRYKLARLIVLYRSNHGPFRQPEDLLGIPLVDDSIYRKIEHYIKTENSPL
ncbi:helix-hairpin-helix domain-containing protein [Chitinophaga filiformis]|uniref:Helix-hairpin-helix motif-containing protein n=1 Tax=Chitinophaga filiformis TaxID=104663 RepID=A0A1G7TX45_CHIFI|nr:helix-hairpin-helix domain-containing protein [Chitinophaga filiformis]SDG39915.1 Helix-hairpin-helix motif-containing protein [Chitinophaga filiformis]